MPFPASPLPDLPDLLDSLFPPLPFPDLPVCFDSLPFPALLLRFDSLLCPWEIGGHVGVTGSSTGDRVVGAAAGAPVKGARVGVACVTGASIGAFVSPTTGDKVGAFVSGWTGEKVGSRVGAIGQTVLGGSPRSLCARGRKKAWSE